MDARVARATTTTAATRPGRRWRADDGQAVPLAAALVAIAALLVIGIGTLAGDVGDAGRARSAADAAALAGAAGGRVAAARLAAANGGALVAWQGDADDVVVTVRVGRATATARATQPDRSLARGLARLTRGEHGG
jgi:hypothetical protein